VNSLKEISGRIRRKGLQGASPWIGRPLSRPLFSRP
jgi:hypothetical protein